MDIGVQATSPQRRELRGSQGSVGRHGPYTAARCGLRQTDNNGAIDARVTCVNVCCIGGDVAGNYFASNLAAVYIYNKGRVASRCGQHWWVFLRA